ncbi:hypothetical protein F4778DRAFT_733515 [Xylariomycetidae sp. FL2044]|nr:hypothetical protein F4778DRAFT_733515 [Xylariomycetidae sp. FL2044]
MGCCFSQPSPSSSGPEAPSSPPSARAINPHLPLRTSATEDPSAAAAALPSSTSSSRDRRHRRRSQRQQQQQQQPPLSQHIDKPLRRHEWVARGRAWTRRDLDTERADFFDTRVSGRPEVWQVLRAALEVMWEADINNQHNNHNNNSSKASKGPIGGGEGRGENNDDDDEDDDLATAQSILKAAEVTLPTGNLANGVYDALGNYYALPEWIVCDPVNVAAAAAAAAGEEDVESKTDDRDDLQSCVEEEEEDGDNADANDEEVALRRKEDKGKGKGKTTVSNAARDDLIKVRARLSETGGDVLVSAAPDESVRSIAKKVLEESGLPSTRRIRIAYMGKILKENTSLLSQGWKKGYVVNALVFDR